MQQKIKATIIPAYPTAHGEEVIFCSGFFEGRNIVREKWSAITHHYANSGMDLKSYPLGGIPL